MFSFRNFLKNIGSSTHGRMVRGVLIGVLISLLLVILYGLSLLEPFELKTLDWRFRVFSSPKEASSDIVIVVVDQKSLDYYENLESIPWPWPRGLYEAIVDFANMGGAKAIIFDILFTERSGYGYEDDEYFIDVVRKAGDVYMPMFMSRKERPMRPELIEYLISERALDVKDESKIAWESYRSIVLPLDGLVMSARGLGNVMMAPDADGIYRHASLLSKYEGKFFPSLPLAVAKDILGVKKLSIDGSNRLILDGLLVPLEEDGSMLIKYYGGTVTYKYYSIASLIQSFARLQEGTPPIIAPEEFKDKIVLVGLTAPGLYDLKPTPFSSVYPGVEIHATVINNILQGDFLTRISAGGLFLLIFTINILCGVTISYFVRLKQSIPIVCGCIIFPLIIALMSFRNDLWFDLVTPELGALLTVAAAAIVSYSTEGRQRRFIKNAFKHYLSPQVIDELMKNPERLRLGGEKRKLTVFFSDIAGFTSLSEKLSPEELSELLCEYLTRMTDIILGHQGTLDKYEGDAIMAFWGAPIAQSDHAYRACVAALECQVTLETLRREFSDRGWPRLYVRIGINSGEMVVGNMGSKERFDYTVLGDDVNLGSRLEGANKEFGTSIMISESTYQLAKNGIEVRELDMIRVKGKEAPVRVYELLARKGELTGEKVKIVELFQRGLSLYRERRWREAIEIFKELQEDPPSKVFLHRCTQLLKSPPPEDWDGVWTLRTK